MSSKIVVGDLSKDILGALSGMITHGKEYKVYEGDGEDQYTVTLDSGVSCTTMHTSWFKDKPVIPKGWTFRVSDNGIKNIESLIGDKSIKVQEGYGYWYGSFEGRVFWGVLEEESLDDSEEFPVMLVTDVEGFKLSEPIPVKEEEYSTFVKEILNVLEKDKHPILAVEEDHGTLPAFEPQECYSQVPAFTITERLGDKEITKSFGTMEDYVYYLEMTC